MLCFVQVCIGSVVGTAGAESPRALACASCARRDFLAVLDAD